MEETLTPIIDHIPARWREPILIFILISPYLTRAYHAISTGGGIRGMLSAVWFGTNQPKSDPKTNP